MAVTPVVAEAYSGIEVALSVETPEWEMAGLGDIAVMAFETFAAAAKAAELPADTKTEVAVTLADDETVKAANAEWRGKNKPTNILSFPMEDLEPGEKPGPLLGDLLLAFETLTREAEEENKALSHHLRHLFVHGFLHLVGFDHQDDDEAEAMEALETVILAGFGIADPYRDTELERPSAPVSSA